jgi:NAD(P)-dependent dehydrogenase (short-subunit alcohol dehydrogenase family)
MDAGRVAIVTGSSRGIGRGIAKALAEHAWHLVIGYPSQPARPVGDALASIDGKYSRVLAYDANDPANPWKQ